MLITGAVSTPSALTVHVCTAAGAVAPSRSARCAGAAPVHLHFSGAARHRGVVTAAEPRPAAGAAREAARC
ncbi:MAG: hypothetical protein OXH96_07675 [Spirochaetaceae bacterium]|nr:hypothetical protein [Spirochaetaceae bacterium]